MLIAAFIIYVRKLALSVVLATPLTVAVAATPSMDLTLPPLFAERDGIALSLVPGFKRLKVSTRFLSTNHEISATWTATTDVPWLEVTPNGNAQSKLTVTALPKHAPSDQPLLATVIVTTIDSAGLQSTIHIAVSFWKSSMIPAEVKLSEPQAVATLANPVRPEVYVVTNGGIKVFNTYTGAFLRTMAAIAPELGQIQVSSDGNFLFVSDLTNQKIITIDVASDRILQSPKMHLLEKSSTIAYARPNGRGTLFIGGNQPLDPFAGTYIGATLPAHQTITANPIGTQLASPETTWSIISDNNGYITLGEPVIFEYWYNYCIDVALSLDGRKVYPACPGIYQFNAYDTRTGQWIQNLAATPYPVNTQIDVDGQFIGGVSGVYQSIDTRAYNKRGFIIKEGQTNGGFGQSAKSLSLSGDTYRFIVLGEIGTSDGNVRIRSLIKK